MAKKHRNADPSRHPMQRNVTVNQELSGGVRVDRITDDVTLNRTEKRRLRQVVRSR